MTSLFMMASLLLSAPLDRGEMVVYPTFVGDRDDRDRQCISEAYFEEIPNTRGASLGLSLRNTCQRDVEIRVAIYVTTNTWRTLNQSYIVAIGARSARSVYLTVVDQLQANERGYRITPMWEFPNTLRLPSGPRYEDAEPSIRATEYLASLEYYDDIVEATVQAPVRAMMGSEFDIHQGRAIYQIGGTWTTSLGNPNEGTAIGQLAGVGQISLQIQADRQVFDLVLDDETTLSFDRRFITGTGPEVTVFWQQLAMAETCAVSHVYGMSLSPAGPADDPFNRIDVDLVVSQDQGYCGPDRRDEGRDLVGEGARWRLTLTREQA